MTLPASAALYAEFGWEDGTSTVQGYYEGSATLTLANSDEEAAEGTRSLKMVETNQDGTPQAYIFWITGLLNGDAIVAGFDVFDVTPGASPSGRIWGHYTDGVSIDSYEGSASGNLEYSLGNGWTNLQWTWQFDGSDPGRTGLIVEARIYSGTGTGTNVDGNTIYVDKAWVVVSNNNALIQRPDGSYVPEPVLGLGALAGLVLLLRSRS
jgi:hypothetical protein